MKQSLFLFILLMSQLICAEEDIQLLTSESDYCAGKALNPDHCQEDGIYYHFKKEPIYPLEALKNGIGGFDKVKFDTNSEGCTVNHRIVESSPISEFWLAAIKAIKNYRYSAEARRLVETINFKIQN